MRLCMLPLLGAGVLLFAAVVQADSGKDSYSRWPKVRLAGVSVGIGYSHFSGGYPFFGYPYGYPYYAWSRPFFGSPFLFDPWYYGPYWGAIPPAAYYQDSSGKVKLNVPDKDASVYIDGGFAGTVGGLKDIRIEPGTHDLKIVSGNQSFEQKIYVLTGRTLNVHPDFKADGVQP